jgi:hypothetical protein
LIFHFSSPQVKQVQGDEGEYVQDGGLGNILRPPRLCVNHIKNEGNRRDQPLIRARATPRDQLAQ